MTTECEVILAMWHERRSAMGPMFAKMEEIRRLYNGDLVLPLPQVDKVEKAAVANLVQQGIDQLGARISSVKPDVDCPPLFPGQPLSERKARDRRLAIMGWWDHSMMDVLDGRRARHLLAYASSPVMIRPGHSKSHAVPTWHVRSPLQSYPGPRPNPDDMTPNNCIFSYEVTLGFIKNRYPEAYWALEKGNDDRPDSKFEVLEYVDDDEFVMLIVGKAPVGPGGGTYGSPTPAPGAPFAQVLRQVNRAGMCTAVVPKRTSLDMPIGKFDGMTGMFQMQARLMALTLIAVQRSVFTKEWLVGRPGELPEVLTEAVPEDGRTGVVTGGVLQPQQVTPPAIAMQMSEMLEANQRAQGGLPQEMSGQSPTNVRTGKRGADIMSAQVDFPIQEAQTLLARSKEAENTIGIAISKAYYGNQQVSFYIRKMKGNRGKVNYTPNKTFDSDVNFVDYPNAGSDANQLTVLIGQLLSLKTLSIDSAQRMHPLIDDPTHEKEMIISESLQDALLAAIAQQVQGGQLSAVDVANISLALEENKYDSLAAAVNAVHQQEQDRQANQPPPGTPPGPAGAPGLAPTPDGGPGGAAVPPGQVPPGVQPPTPSIENLATLLGSLHGGAQSPVPAGAPA
jgi:hypothetical protein